MNLDSTDFIWRNLKKSVNNNSLIFINLIKFTSQINLNLFEGNDLFFF